MLKIATLWVLLCLEHYKIFANGQIPSYSGFKPPEHEMLPQEPLSQQTHDIKIQHHFVHPRDKDGNTRLDHINPLRKIPRRMIAPLNQHRHIDRRDFDFNRNKETGRNMYRNPQSRADSFISGPTKFQTANKIISINIPNFIEQTKFRNTVHGKLETDILTNESAASKNYMSPITLASTARTILNVKSVSSGNMKSDEKVEIITVKTEHKKKTDEIPLQVIEEDIKLNDIDLSQDKYLSTTIPDYTDDTTTFTTDTTDEIENRSGLSASVIGSLLGK